MRTMTKWNYKNGLPPLKKAKLGDEFEFLESEEIFKTNIDGFPYIVLESFTQELNKKDKFSIEGEQGMYTVTSIDFDRKVLEAKVDKVLDLTERTVNKIKDYYIGWGMKKEAEKVKANYLWNNGSNIGGCELAVEGKLSKNQVVQFHEWIIKITNLKKNEDGLIEIDGDFVDRWEVSSVYPYKEYGEVKGWYDDYADVLLRQVTEFNNKLKRGEVKL